MNIIGKTVCHIKDGFGTITEYYPANDYIKVQFSSGVIRPYHFPHDFYPEGVLSSSPREIIDLALQQIQL